MNPRLKTSKKWTDFPKEYIQQIREVFEENFKSQLTDSKLIIQGRIYPEEILLRVGVLKKGRLAQNNFDISMNYSPKKKDAVERIYDCIDAAASMLHDHFNADDETEFPRTWQEFQFNEQSLYLQFNTENTELEAQADALLGKSLEEMIKEEEENEDAFEKAEPSMMGRGSGKKKIH